MDSEVSQDATNIPAVAATSAPPSVKASRSYIEVIDAVPVLDTGRFEHMQRIATVMAQMSFVPESLRTGKDGDGDFPLPSQVVIANCFMVVNQAVRWNFDPFAVLQSVSLVRGKLCYEGKLIHAVLEARLNYQLRAVYSGDEGSPDYTIEISAWDAGRNCVVENPITKEPLSVVGSVSEWTTGAKGAWGHPKNHRRMLFYRGCREWARLHAPAVLLGVYSSDEMDDMIEDVRDRRRAAKPPRITESLAQRQLDAPTAGPGFKPSSLAEAIGLTEEERARLAPGTTGITVASAEPDSDAIHKDTQPEDTPQASPTAGDAAGEPEAPPAATREEESVAKAPPPPADNSDTVQEEPGATDEELEAAAKRGARSKRNGMARRGVPGEYRGSSRRETELREAWLKAWDEADIPPTP